MTRALRIRDRGLVAHRHEADILLEHPGDFILVKRGVLRSFVMSCPDGCGDTITLNLDPRTDKAWRFYRKHNQISVFPSVWRDTSCCSHFIIWNHNIIWCGIEEETGSIEVENEADIRREVLSLCTTEWQHFAHLAEKLDEVPWSVNKVCCYLAHRLHLLDEGTKKLRGFFRLHK